MKPVIKTHVPYQEGHGPVAFPSTPRPVTYSPPAVRGLAERLATAKTAQEQPRLEAYENLVRSIVNGGDQFDDAEIAQILDVAGRTVSHLDADVRTGREFAALVAQAAESPTLRAAADEASQAAAKAREFYHSETRRLEKAMIAAEGAMHTARMQFDNAERARNQLQHVRFAMFRGK
jgi:hypothetical protein